MPNDVLRDDEAGKLIILRNIALFKIMKEGTDSFIRLVSNLLEQSIHYKEFIFGNAILYNDFVALANDLRKFG